METSSNINMKKVFEHLENIQMAEPNTNLYARTLNKVKRQNIIPLFWVRAVACVLLAFISTELYFTFNKTQSNEMDISIMIYKTNNILYNE